LSTQLERRPFATAAFRAIGCPGAAVSWPRCATKKRMGRLPGRSADAAETLVNGALLARHLLAVSGVSDRAAKGGDAFLFF